MKYIASALFFSIWAYLYKTSAGATGDWLLLPFLLGFYLFVIAEVERIRESQPRPKDGEGAA